MLGLEISGSLKDSVAAVASAQSEYERIATIHRQAETDLEIARERHLRAKNELRLAESNAALGNIATEKKSRDAFFKSREEQDVALARVEGLALHLETARAALDAARMPVLAAWEKWCEAGKAAFIEEYDAAADKLRGVIECGLGFAQSIEANGMYFRLSKIYIPESSHNHLQIRGIDHRRWLSNPRAMDVFNDVMAVKKEVGAGTPKIIATIRME